MTHNIREARILTEMAREQKSDSNGNQGASNPYLKWFRTGLIKVN